MPVPSMNSAMSLSVGSRQKKKEIKHRIWLKMNLAKYLRERRKHATVVAFFSFTVERTP